MRTCSFTIAAVISLMGVGVDMIVAQPPPRPEDEPPQNPDYAMFSPQRVVVFKDGYALFTKEARAKVSPSGTVFTHDVPKSAVLGTVWAASTAGPRLLSMTSGWQLRREQAPGKPYHASFTDLLRANVGKRALVELNDGRTVSGTVVAVLTPAPPPPPDPPGAPQPEPGAESAVTSARVAPNPRFVLSGPDTTTLRPEEAQLVALDTDSGRHVIPLARVQGITAADLQIENSQHRHQPPKVKTLTFDFGTSAAGQDVAIRLIYFTRGVRWIPTYRLGVDFDGESSLELQGEVINDAEDITSAAVDLVVGVPNFRFREDISPLSLEAAMRATLSQTAPNLLSQQFLSNAFERPAESAPAADPRDAALTLAPDLIARGSEALFSYGVAALSLRKGDRAVVPIWSGSVKARRTYSYDLHVVRGSSLSDQHAAADSPARDRLSTRVWQSAELVNRSRLPWTTGACLVLDGQLPLAQEMLAYTPPGSATLIPLTVAPDIRGTHREQETGRQPNALAWGGHRFSRITKRGEITVTNFRPEPTTVALKFETGGRVTQAPESEQIVINDFDKGDWEGAMPAVNNHSSVQWKVALNQGESKTVEYTVEYYLP
ncbi:MAG: DUF4139 domain-containing protein [Candidatus Sumerlaeaceae bacterium]|nr:DUF4139 domain-containing protein [Candidatus Sumerlaeaceae bacterium]